MKRRLLPILGILACGLGTSSCATTPAAIATAMGLSAASDAVSNVIANPPQLPSGPPLTHMKDNDVVDTPNATIVNKNGETIILMKPRPAQPDYTN